MQAYVTYLHYWWTKIKGYVLDLIFLFPWFHWIVLLCSSLSASSLQQLGDATMELSFHNAQRCFLLPTKSFILQLILQYAFLLSPLGCGKTNLMFHLFVRLKLMLILATFWRSSCLYKFGFDGCILWEVKEALLKNMLSFKAGFEIIYEVWFICVHVVCKVYNMSCVECLLFCSGSLARCVFRKVHFDWVRPSLSFLQWNSKVLRAYSVRFMIFYTQLAF